MGVPMRYRKKPAIIEAIRYGKDEDGRWYPGAVTQVALFLLNLSPDSTLPANSSDSVIRTRVPQSGIVPPFEEMEIYDEVAHKQWLPLSLGDYVLRGVEGEFYPCKADIFHSSYEIAREV